VVPDPHGMVFTPTPNISKALETNYVPLMGWWIHHHATSTIFVCLKFRELAGFLGHTGYKWCHGALVEAPDPHGMSVMPPQNVSKVFQNIHIVLIGRWIHHHASCHIHHVCLAQIYGVEWKSWVTPGLHIMSWCIGWGPRPTWNGFHTQWKHIQGII
jgi:hypothetical protein